MRHSSGAQLGHMCFVISYAAVIFFEVEEGRGVWKIRAHLTLGANSPLPSLSQTSAKYQSDQWLYSGLRFANRTLCTKHTLTPAPSAPKAILSGYSKWCVFLNSYLIGQTKCQYLAFFSPLHGTCPCFSESE